MQNDAGILRVTLALWVFVAIVGVATKSASAQTLTWLGTLGGDWSEAFDVSADGKLVVGCAKNASGWVRAFRWVQGQGMEDLN